MDFDKLKELLENFDLAEFLPDLSSLVGWVELLLRIAVMVGPLMLLGFGLLYLIAPPKEANYSLGFRCWWGMSSLESWLFTQKTAGILWSLTGLVLTIVMAVKCAGFKQMAPTVMLDHAVLYLLWELGITVITCVIVVLAVFIAFDRKGYRRWGK